MQSYLKILTILLVSSGILSGCTSARTNSFADVYEAARSGDTEFLNELVEEGASLDTLNDNNITPLCYAYLKKDQNAINLLTAYGAKTGANCVVRTNNGTEASGYGTRSAAQSSQTLVKYVPEHNPPQKHYPKPMNNSVITTTILGLGAIAGIVILICIL